MIIIERKVRGEAVEIAQAYRQGNRVRISQLQRLGINEQSQVASELRDVPRTVLVDAPIQILTGGDAADFELEAKAGRTPKQVPKGWHYAWTRIGKNLVFATEQAFEEAESQNRMPDDLYTAMAFHMVRKAELQKLDSSIQWNISESRIQVFVYQYGNLVKYDTEYFVNEAGKTEAVAGLIERTRINGKATQAMYLTGANYLTNSYETWLLEPFKRMTGVSLDAEYVPFGTNIIDEQSVGRDDVSISIYSAAWAANTGIGPDFYNRLLPVPEIPETGLSVTALKRYATWAKASLQPVAAGLILGILVGGGVFLRANSLESQRGESLAQKMREEEKIEKENEKIQTEITDIDARLQVIKKIKKAIETETPKQKSLSNLLQLLQTRYVPGLVLTEFSGEGSQLTFSGYIADTSVYGREGGGPIDAGNLLGQFIRSLEQSGEVNNIVPEIKNESEKMATFRVTCTFKGVTGKEPLELPATSKLLEEAKAAAIARQQQLTAEAKERK